MPDIEGSMFCIDVFNTIGRAVMGYASLDPLPWSEINSYQAATGVTLSAWEAETVRFLSDHYVSQSRISQDENCPAPYTPEMTPEMIKAHARMLRQKMRS